MLADEEALIDTADFRPSAVDDGPEYQGTFENPQRPIERRRGGTWSGPGRRSTDPEIARFADDGGPT